MEHKLTHDPFYGDDSFGACLFEQSEIEEKKRLRKTKPGENVEGSEGDREALERDYSEDLESDNFDD
jgi:hypothetical protein